MNLHVMADKMAFFLVRKEIVSKDKSDIYSYGLEILIATIINGLLVITASLILCVFWQTILLLVPFILIRGNAGGFHAKTHLGCVLGFMTTYLAGVLSVGWLATDILRAVMLISLPAAAAVITIIGALPHKNRPVSSNELACFKTRARLLTCCLMIIGFSGLFLASEWFIFFSLGINIAAGSLIAGWIQVKLGRGCA